MTQVELVIEQGATFRRTFTWLTGTPSAPVNLTGYSARMQIRKTTASSTAYATLTSANGGIVLGGAARLPVVAVRDAAVAELARIVPLLTEANAAIAVALDARDAATADRTAASAAVITLRVARDALLPG